MYAIRSYYGIPILTLVDNKGLQKSTADELNGIVAQSVITSYSIHYTKLYEFQYSFTSDYYKNRMRIFLGDNEPVITSYSIHYTKLYDLGR